MQKDTIQRIVDPEYYLETLRIVEGGAATFDSVRLGLITLARRKGAREESIARTGYGVAKRLRTIDKYTYWSNAQDSLAELMKLGFIESNPLPSKRQHLESHRDTKYAITKTGRDFLDLIKSGEESPRDLLFRSMYQAHPYLRALLSVANQTEIVIPEYRITGRFPRDSQPSLQEILADGCKWLLETKKGLNVEKFRLHLEQKIERYKGRNSSDFVKTMNEGIERLYLEEYGLPSDEVTFDQLLRICRWSLVMNYTRSLPNVSGLVVFRTAELAWQGGKLLIHRHRIQDYASKIIEEIPKAFDTLEKPFVPVHEVRALVCHRLHLNNEVFDQVVQDLALSRREAQYQLTVMREIYTPLPPSESPLTFNGSHYYMVSLSQKQEGMMA